MQATVSSHDHRRLAATRRIGRSALGIATGLVIVASLLTGCSGRTTTEFDSVTVNDHLYLKGPDGTTFEISVGKDATGKDAVTATRVGD